jgi:hypothetical protein
VTQGERARFVTMWEAGLQQFSIQFAKGDPHARRDAFRIAEKLGSEFLTPKKAFDETLAGEPGRQQWSRKATIGFYRY